MVNERMEETLRTNIVEALLCSEPPIFEYLRTERTLIAAITIADLLVEKGIVIPVYCKDCEYRKKAKVNEKGFLICPASGMEITETDFCSYGERRTDGD